MAVYGNNSEAICKNLEIFPKVVYRGETVELEYKTQAEATSLNLYATNTDKNPEQGEGLIYRFNKRFTKNKDTDTFSLKFSTEDDGWDKLATGSYQYQFWSNLGRKKTCCFTGEFSVVLSLVNRLDNPEEPDTGYISDTERQYRTLQKAYDQYMLSGVAAFTLSGNSTTRLSPNQMLRELNRLKRIVNKERKAKGLPYLPGTLPSHITHTFAS